MDDVYTRARYSRYGGSARKRRRTSGGGIAAKVAKQVFVSALILTTLWYIKDIDSPISTHVLDGVEWVVEKSVEPKMMYDSIKNMFSNLLPGGNSQDTKKDFKETDKDSQPANEDSRTVYEDSHVADEDSLGANRDSRQDVNMDSRTANGDEGQWGQFPAGNVLSAGVQKDSPPFILPLNASQPDRYIAVPFGERKHYLSGEPEFHCGIDIAAKRDAEVLAALEGHVIETGNKDTYGLYVKIDHGKGWQTVYGHCSEVLVETGDEVKQGDTVAGIKPAGTESHLHFEIWYDGMPVDPLLYLEEALF